MPRFYFDFQLDGVTEPDDIGVELPTLEAARGEAARAAAAVIADRVRGTGSDLSLHVRDAEGEPLFTVRASVALTPPRSPEGREGLGSAA